MAYIHVNQKKMRWYSLRKTVAMMAIALCSSNVWSQANKDDSWIIGNPKHLAPVTGSFNPLRYSEGYMFGIITRAADSGILIHTLEGQMRLGVVSASGGMLDRDCFDRRMSGAPADQQSDAYRLFESNSTEACTILVNPWEFSNFNASLVEPLSKYQDVFSMIYYRSYFWVPFLASHNYLVKIYPVDQEVMPVGSQFEIPGFTVESLLHYSKGFVEGRFVKASLDNVIRKAYDVVVQLSNSGNIFQELNVDDDRVFDFVLKAMASGRYLRVSYYRLIGAVGDTVNFVRGDRTLYRIYKIEVIEPPSTTPDQTTKP